MKTFYFAKHKDGRYLACRYGDEHYWTFYDPPELFSSKGEVECILRAELYQKEDYMIEEVNLK